jgi:hypothetical protein
MRWRDAAIGFAVGVAVTIAVVVAGIALVRFLDDLSIRPSRHDAAMTAMREHSRTHDAPRGTSFLADVHRYDERGACIEVAFFGDDLPNDRVVYYVEWGDSGGATVAAKQPGWYDEAAPLLRDAGYPC